MSSYVSQALRQLVAERANHLCEYCLIHEEDTFLGCQIEHVISEKHGGRTVEENLAFACVFCNRFKGSDLGSLHPSTGELVRFFNPRTDRWSEHFRIVGLRIVALTGIGEVTARILEFNHGDRVLEREQLKAAGRFPSPAALAHIAEFS
ncbi:MAG TPA: HNH endonuclease signature motif containing protein [Tepidisphaeraceae bacterium]|nr:HNH endonuclease signature motif containing protein [Tepidisphaeraceae bacterium]